MGKALQDVAEERSVHFNDECEATLLAKEVGVADKSGTVFTSTAHLLTTQLGLGVLALPSAMAALGWVAGPIVIILFYGLSLLSSELLLKVYDVDGVQHPRYYDAVDRLLGRRMKLAAGYTQVLNCVLVCIAYQITAATCLKTIASIACGLPVGADASSSTADSGSCFNYQWAMALFFGAFMVLVCQMKDIESSWLISALGASCSFVFSFIAIGLSIARMVGGSVYGTVQGNPYGGTADKVFNVMNALGTAGFAYGISYVQLEVHDTVPPPSEGIMRKACHYAMAAALALYMTAAVIGYMAFGDETPSMLLTAFSSPGWLLIVANVIVIFDMTSSFNIFSQTVFLTIEEWAAHKLGLLHPAEAAALDAADDAWTAEDMEGSEKEPKPERMPPASPATAPACPATGAVLRTRTLQRSTAGDRVVLRTRTPHPRSGAYLPRGADGNQVEVAADGLDLGLLKGKVLTTVASRAHRTVHCIAGPLRMTSMLRDAKVLRPELPRIKVWSARSMSFLIRAAYVGVVTVVAVFCPFFGSVAGLVGAVAYWPLQILFPTLMVFSAYRDELPAWKRQGLVAVNIGMAVISVCAVIGSFRGMITGWETFSLA